jgi:hypothetical protein
MTPYLELSQPAPESASDLLDQSWSGMAPHLWKHPLLAHLLANVCASPTSPPMPQVQAVRLLALILQCNPMAVGIGIFP